MLSSYGSFHNGSCFHECNENSVGEEARPFDWLFVQLIRRGACYVEAYSVIW